MSSGSTTSGPKGNEAPGDTHFGFRTVRSDEKARLVRDVFDSVASRYDVMNDLMSAGVHRLWKQAMIDWLAPRPGMKILDVAGGTGDIAARIVARAPGASVVLADINAAMLSTGRDRLFDKGIIHGLDYIVADAEHLPVADQSVDAYTIAFGIRNVTNIANALKEARRVLKPGGRFMCLEFSAVRIPLAAKLYDLYSFHVVPKIGQVVAKDAESYQYLVESIRRFPDQETFAAMITDAGLSQVKVRDLSGGIAALHSAWRI